MNAPPRALAGVAVPPAVLARLETLEALVRKWTVRINLVAPSTAAELWTRHIADSAQLWPLAPPEARTWVDLGSGGGFPGLVIAALAAGTGRPAVTLIESDGRNVPSCARRRAPWGWM
ncbi:putative S-adenosylmethionine-dependent methyltransferase involved in bacterial cell division [Rubellimicrobium thermophilum DSM 16684]|uniref:Putative S-adenosylmethionine-dependent methyltransferase involved in bacterial cell division n=1 Tax=Rubellimicrobium thermophilum DSM 16684 TaxID=1123069 RepID=S9QXR0_9RHOB|nr:putative S-adenosylmethionine-dependent methyltransferase involved in bacterial cell division [Rubellimicrobium thermophilum DSM 16684]